MIDNIGRNIDSGMSGADLKGLVESLAKGSVGKAKPFNATASQDSDKLLSDLKSYIPKFSTAIKSVENLVKSVKDFMGNKGKETKNDKMGFNADKMMKKLAEHGLKKGSIYTHDIHVEKIQKLMYLQMQKQTVALQALNACLCPDKAISEADIEKKIKPLESDFRGTETMGEVEDMDSDSGLGAVEKTAKLGGLMMAAHNLEEFGNQIGELQRHLLGFRATEIVFKDLVAAERDFTIDVRQIAFEIAGATKESKSLQKSFEEIGETARITGFDRSTTQAAYLKALKKGTKEQKVALGIVKNQLNTEKMIGVEAGTLEDTFSNMSLQMDMSNSQMGEFGRGILDVARSTGVTGENLARAIRSSERIMKNMRNFGTITAKGAANIVGALASAEKFGVGEFAEGLFDTLSQGIYGFNNANREMQSFIAQAVGGNSKLLQQMQDGTLQNSKEGMNELAGGIDNMLARFGVHSEEQFKNMSSSQKQYINTMMKSAFGVTAVEALKTSKSIKEANKPFIEQLKDIEKERDAVNKITDVGLRKEKELALAEKERSLGASASLGMLSSIQEKMKAQNLSFDEAAASLKSAGGSFEADLLAIENKIGAKGSDLIPKTIEDLNKKLMEAKETPLNIDPKEIEEALKDPTKMESIMERVNEGNQRLAAAQKAASDPITNLNRTMTDLNDTLRGKTQSAISNLFNAVNGNAVYYAGVTSSFVDLAGQIVGFTAGSIWQYKMLRESLGQLGNDIGGAGGFLGKLFGGKGAASATGAAGGAASAAGGAADRVAGTVGGGMEKFGQMLAKLGDNKTIKGAGTIALLGAALLMAAHGFKTFGEVKWEGMGMGTVALLGLIGVARLVGEATTGMVKGAVVIALLGGALLLSSYGFKAFGDVNWEDVGKGALALGILTAAALLLGNVSTQVLLGAAAILVLGASMWVAGKGFQTFNDIKWESLMYGAVALGVFTAAIFALGALFVGTGGVAALIFGAGLAGLAALGGTVAILGVSLGIASTGMALFAESLKSIGEIDGGNLMVVGAGLAAIGIGMGVFAVGMLAGTASGVVSGIASLFGVKSPLDKIKEFIPMADKFWLIGEGIRAFGEGIRELNKSVSEFDKDSFKEIKNAILDFALAEKMNLMASVAFSPTSSLIGAAASMLSPTVATTAPNILEDRVEREVASVESSATGAGSEELGSIANTSQKQVDKMDQMIDLLTQMVAHLAPSTGSSSGSGAESETTMNNVATSPPKYYKWSMGKHNQGAAIGITNLSNIG
jgi:hypothetical protein